MAHVTEGATCSVAAVGFNFMTAEEVRKHSVLKVTNTDLLDFMGRPMPGGLYDPVLGPLEDRTDPCKSCGLMKLHCPGHCGHIDLVCSIYNPLMFNFLHTILQKTCFFCYHFREERAEVKRRVAQLKLLGKGDIVGAKRLDSDCMASYPDYSEGSQVSSSMVHDYEAVNSKEWTSLQLTEAVSVLSNFLKLKYKKCKNCDMKNPVITKPIFGWFDQCGISGAQTRENVIRAGFGIEDANDTNISGSLLPSQVKEIVKLLWDNEVELCSLISNIQQQGFGEKLGCDMFFLETILVPPINFRPPTKGGDSVMEHPQTHLLSKVLLANFSLGEAYTKYSKSSEEKDKKRLLFQSVLDRWKDLQQSVNLLFDNKTAMSQKTDPFPGICQLVDKKQGILRQKMTGKRVNFACRSVKSPDPYLAVNEIGIPIYFALRLTYPERVTPWNIEKLRKAIVNGPESHPGATHYIDNLSIKRLPLNREKRISIARNLSSSKGAIVVRHIQEGDVVLVNRQFDSNYLSGSLHSKPSIMAHIVRVLKGEKTIRMHYANCSTYNADFDGDEINLHFSQDEISRAEAYNIVNATKQYVRPSNGEPIRALIQDHIASAVLLTKRDTFLSSDEFNQLLYSSGVSSLAHSSFSGKPSQKIFISSSEEEMVSTLPAILKPKPLWTGKQVISSVLHHITRGNPPFTVEKTGKIPHEFFKNTSSEIKPNNDGLEIKDAGKNLKKEPDEEKLLIYRNDLVRGVIDKAHFAEYGLVHTVQQLYGSDTAGFLLSAFSRLFTVFLQMHGFTCGVDDLLIMKDKDIERKKQLEECEAKVTVAHYEFCGVKMDSEIGIF